MDGRETARPLRRVGAVLLLLAAPVLAGCTLPAAVEPRVRAGDFIVLDLVAWDEGGSEVLRWAAQPAVAAAEVPARVPEGWNASATHALPPGLSAALLGAPPGAVVETPLLPPADAFGNWSVEKTIRAPVRERLSTVVNVTARDVVPSADGGARVHWAGGEWDAEVLGSEGDVRRVRLVAGPGDAGALLELPDYWSDRYQLWRSRLVAADDAALTVEHLAEVGRSVSVAGIDYRLGRDNDTVWADGNHPLAGRSLRFQAKALDIAFPGSAGRPVAPEALLVTVEGRAFNVSDLRGGPALLDFYATWCVTCKQQAPIYARAQEEFGDRVRIVSVSIDPTDTADRVEAFKAEARARSLLVWGRELPVNWTFAHDPTLKAAQAFSVSVLPREVLLDADGRIRGTHVGLHPWPDLKAELEAVLADAPAA